MSKRHLPALDGLRGLAVLMVLLFHTAGGTHSHFLPLRVAGLMNKGGWIGVTLFFVLSGFLITGILWDTRRDPNWWHNFYARRALRIFPLYYAALLLVLIAAAFAGTFHAALSRIGYTALFLQDLPYFRQSILRTGSPLPLFHFWSLAVEEQFYLVWPALLLLQRDRRSALRLCAFTFAVSAAFRLVVWSCVSNPEPFEQFLLTRAGELAAGAWLAIAYRDKLWAKLKRPAQWVAIGGAAVFVVTSALSGTADSRGPWQFMLGLPAVTLSFAALLIVSLQDGWVSRALSVGWLRFIGSISYGVYVYHVLLMPGFERVTARLTGVHAGERFLAVRLVVAAVGSIAVAWLSFRFFEQPVLKLKRFFGGGAESSTGLGVVKELTRPMRNWSRRERRLAIAISTAACSGLALYRGFKAEWFFYLSDTAHYLLIAQGDEAHVMKPFAARQLGSLVAGGLGRMLHLTVERGFIVEGIFSLVGAVAISFWLMSRTAAPRWMLAAVAVLPFWTELFHNLAKPDTWYAALLAVTLLLMAQRQWTGAAGMMFPLMVSRESTWLTLICFLAAAWKPLRWRGRAVAVVAAAAGAAVVQRLSRDSLDNREHLPQALYLLGKMPWNFARNVLGLQPWSNIYQSLCTVPAKQFALHVASVRAVGYCSYSSTEQQLLLDAILTMFGLLPVLLAVLWWRRRGVRGREPLLSFALLYGAAAFVLTPVLGTGANHLLGYSWPLFVAAVPELMGEAGADRWPWGAALGFLFLHLVLVLLPFPGPWRLQLCTKMVLWGMGFWILRRWGIGAESAVSEAAVQG